MAGAVIYQAGQRPSDLGTVDFYCPGTRVLGRWEAMETVGRSGKVAYTAKIDEV